MAVPFTITHQLQLAVDIPAEDEHRAPGAENRFAHRAEIGLAVDRDGDPPRAFRAPAVAARLEYGVGFPLRHAATLIRNHRAYNRPGMWAWSDPAVDPAVLPVPVQSIERRRARPVAHCMRPFETVGWAEHGEAQRRQLFHVL